MNLKCQISLYFKPKKIEYFRDKTIYDLIGIKLYKKYLPTTGDIMRQKRKITQIRMSDSGKIHALYTYERKTRNYEWRHILGTIVFVILIVMTEKNLTIFDWIFLTLLNLYVNIYPIFLQRYNRIRILNVLKNNGYQSPYDISK